MIFGGMLLIFIILFVDGWKMITYINSNNKIELNTE